MRYFTLIVAVVFSIASYAQSIPPRDIEDSVLGWMKVYNFKGAKEPMKLDDKLYSVPQLSICDSFANWMQASYIPKGALGDVKRGVSQRLGLYNQHTAALPQSYGVNASMYVFLKYNSSRRIVPETSDHLGWSVYANAVPGWPIRDIITATEYYFTMPSFESASGDDVGKIHDLTKVPTVKPYITFWIKDVEAGNGSDYVLLCKNNRSPFVKLTKGEYLQLLEKAIPRFYEKEKKKIYEQYKGRQRDIDYFIKYLDEKIERFSTGLKKNREKYRDRLNELALTSAQPTLYELENGRDVFSNGYLTDTESTSGKIPVYKIDAAMAELCKKDKPQWVLVSWWWTPKDPVEKNLHESIINNFNFEYVYNFFFDPEKIKGQPYKPLRSPYYKEALVVTAASESSKKNAADKNIHFFEDFSTTGIGKKPIEWKAGLGADGTTSVVVTPDGLEGNWAMMNGDYKITPNQLKKPFPQDFTLSYDLVAAQNFTWGAKGLSLRLSKELSPGNAESFLDLRLRPGFDGRAGEVTLETKFPAPPGYSNGTKWYVAQGFSNDKKNNRVTVTIKKTGETLQVFIDKNKIAEMEKAIPAAHLFNAMSFISGSAGEANKYYISNIKIIKE